MESDKLIGIGPSDFIAGFNLFNAKLATGIKMRFAIGGSGSPILLVHGHPHTHIIWRKIAPKLAEIHTVILPDLRGYGDTEKPESQPDHRPYSKREMAKDLMSLMHLLGFEKFAFIGHDRGARVGHRLALDYPEALTKAVFVDIAPTATMYALTNKEFATKYFWWFFLIQPEPFPEKLIGFDPEYFGLIFDPGNMVNEGFEEYQKSFELLGDYIAHIHIKNGVLVPDGEDNLGAAKWKRQWCPLKKGMADLKRLFSVMNKFGYDGTVSIEDFSNEEETKVKLENNLAYMKGMAEAVKKEAEEAKEKAE